MNFNTKTTTILAATSLLAFAILANVGNISNNVYATDDEIEEIQDDVKNIQETLNTLVITLNDTAAGPGQYQCTPIVVPPTPNETIITPLPCQIPVPVPEQNVTEPVVVQPNVTEPTIPTPCQQQQQQQQLQQNVTEPTTPPPPPAVIPPCPYTQPPQQNVTNEEEEQQPPATIPFIPPLNITEPIPTQPCPLQQQNNVTQPTTTPVPSPSAPQISYNVECHCYVVENGANVTDTQVNN